MCPANALKCTFTSHNPIILLLCMEIASAFCSYKQLSDKMTDLNSKSKYLKFWTAKLEGKISGEIDVKRRLQLPGLTHMRESNFHNSKNHLPSMMMFKPSYRVNQLTSSLIVGFLCFMNPEIWGHFSSIEWKNVMCEVLGASHPWNMILSLANGWTLSSKPKRGISESYWNRSYSPREIRHVQIWWFKWEWPP